jgi:hypothetical protein
MVDLGSVSAEDLSAGEVIEAIEERIEEIRSTTLPMAQITLTGIRKETARVIAGKEMARIRESLLDLRIRTISPDDIVTERRREDSGFNIQEEFASFVKSRGLPEKTESFILQKGSAVLTSVVVEEEME